MSHNVNPSAIVNAPRAMGPGWLIRLVYFIFIGSWLSGLCIVASYVCMVTIVGIPLGVVMLNRLPYLTTLRSRSLEVHVLSRETMVIDFRHGVPQRNWWVRAIWFVLVGWWLTAAFLALAWIGTVLTFGWGALFLYNPVPALLTLHRN